MNARRITRTTFSDGSTIAELWISTTNACPHCGASTTWASPRGGYYRICPSCRRGWELEGATHHAADNPALEQLVEQIARADSAENVAED